MKIFKLNILLIALISQLFGSQPAIYGENGVVVAHDLEACEAGIEILKAGGNAVDAAALYGTENSPGDLRVPSRTTNVHLRRHHGVAALKIRRVVFYGKPIGRHA